MIKGLIREYVKLLVEASPIAYDDTAGTVTYSSPTIDQRYVEKEFDNAVFRDFVRKIYKAEKAEKDQVDLDHLANSVILRYRKLMGTEIDADELRSILRCIAVEEKEFEELSPEEKGRYYADPRFYTKDF